MIKINGKEVPESLGKTVSDYLESEGYSVLRVAVEINNKIIPKAEYERYIISDNDEIEIVSFMGGG